MMKEMVEVLGKRGDIHLGGLIVKVEIMDVKTSYGRVRYLVKPVAGVGEVWIEQVSIDKKK